MKLTPEISARLARVGVVVQGDELVTAPDPPVIDRWTMARLGIWTLAGLAGLDRGTGYMVAGVWELAELQYGRQAVDTLPNRAADLVAAAAGFELGRHLRDRWSE